MSFRLVHHDTPRPARPRVRVPSIKPGARRVVRPSAVSRNVRLFLSPPCQGGIEGGRTTPKNLPQPLLGKEGSKKRHDLFKNITRLAIIAWALALVLMVSVAHAQTETIRIDVKLRTGGALTGMVVDHTDHGLVMVTDGTPYVFAWEELEADNACTTRRDLMTLERGGEDRLTSEDHLRLGRFALRHGRSGFAVRAFRQAGRLDPSSVEPAREALARFREEQEVEDRAEPDASDHALKPTRDEEVEPGLAERIDAELANRPALAPLPAAEARKRVLGTYRKFGAKVQEVIGKDVVLVESAHFLIWTDWEPRYRDRLARWTESMYESLSEAFGLAATDEVFLAKCPVFCWRTKGRFHRFARHFDGYDVTNAIGYTRSIEANGHVHVVLLRQGRSAADFDRFAWTLVHEGTHAFVHRLFTTRLIPHWVNEGLAELTAERILGDRCPAGENAALLARQYVRYDWPIRELLRSTGPIEVYDYPLAHSIVALLEDSGRERFAGFIRDLKDGRALEDALDSSYDHLTFEELEARWRSSVHRTDPESKAHADDSSRLPWATGG